MARYAVFTHVGSLAHIHETVGYVYGEWLPSSGYELAGTPDFELYDERFDPVKDDGELEYWVPVKQNRLNVWCRSSHASMGFW